MEEKEGNSLRCEHANLWNSEESCHAAETRIRVSVSCCLVERKEVKDPSSHFGTRLDSRRRFHLLNGIDRNRECHLDCFQSFTAILHHELFESAGFSQGR